MNSLSTHPAGAASLNFVSHHHAALIALVLSAPFLVNACSDATAPRARMLTVPPLVRDVQPLPPKQALLGAKASDPTPPMLLAYYPFVEKLLVEASIVDKLNITSQQNVILAVSVGTEQNPARVDYRGVWESSGNQCVWNATITSANLRAGGTSCLTTPPLYQSADEWRDTILVGGTDAANDANVYATRGGTPNDPHDCAPGETVGCNCPNGSPCHTVSGVQTFTLIPLAAAIHLTTPGTAEIAPKTILLPDPSNPTAFKVSSTPATIHGITVPTQALSWRWVPAQGDSSVTAQCPAPLTNNVSNTCSVTIFERGSMIVTARVNGVVQVDTVKVVGSQVRITPTSLMMEPSQTSAGLDPANRFTNTQTIRVSVVDTLGNKIPLRVVVLSLIPTAGTGGHAHTNTASKPVGGLSLPQVSTGNSGEATVTYSAPDPSGAVLIKGRSGGSGSVQVQVQIAVPDLHEYGAEIGAVMIGDNAFHPRNHYATSAHIAALSRLVQRYSQMFPDSAQLQINDTSLELGGLFDISGNWDTDHVGHRRGRNTDIKTRKTCQPGQQGCTCHTSDPLLSDAQQAALLSEWMVLNSSGGDFILHRPGDRVCPHIHLAN